MRKCLSLAIVTGCMVSLMCLAESAFAQATTPAMGSDLEMRRLTPIQREREDYLVLKTVHARDKGGAWRTCLPHLAKGKAGDEAAWKKGQELAGEGRFGWYGIAGPIAVGAFGEDFDPDVMERVRENLKPEHWSFPHDPTKLRHDKAVRPFGFGVVNLPAHETLERIISGEVRGDAVVAESGYSNIQRFVRIMSYCGDIPEFNSQTYASPQVISFAGIGAYSRNQSIRLKADLLEERIWLAAASRYFPDGMIGGGARARDYSPEWSRNSAMMFKMLDGNITPGFGFSDAEGVLPYLVPEYLEHIAMRKQYPYYIRSTTANDGAESQGDKFPAGLVNTETYLSGEYILGTSSRDYWGGPSTNPLIIHYRRGTNHADGSAVAYTRYTVNTPGTLLRYQEMGVARVLQQENKALLFYRPRSTALGNSPYGKTTEFRLDLRIAKASPAIEIWMDDKRIDPAQAARADARQAICIRDFRTYIGVRPLAPGDGSLARPVMVWRPRENALTAAQAPSRRRLNLDDYICVSILNHESKEPVLIQPEKIQRMHNGFYLETVRAADYKSFADFRRHMREVKITESKDGTTREAEVTSGATTLYMKADMKGVRILERKVNGAPYSCPILETPDARQSVAGDLAVKDVRVRSTRGFPLLLVRDPLEPRAMVGILADGELPIASSLGAFDKKIHESGISVRKTTPVELTAPWGKLRCNGLGYGKLVYAPEDGIALEVWTLEQAAPIFFTRKAPHGKVYINGNDVTASLQKVTRNGREWFVAPAPQGAPEIDGIAKAPGEALPLPHPGAFYWTYDLGEITEEGAFTRKLSYPMKNYGALPLEIELSWSGGAKGWRVLPARASASLKPGEEATLQFEFQGDTADLYPFPKVAASFGCKGGRASVHERTMSLKRERLYRVRKVEKAPEVNGEPPADFWANTRGFDHFLVRKHPGILADPPTETRVAYDADGLYIVVVCHEPDMQSIRSEAEEHDVAIWHDDCMEIFIDVGQTKADYHWLVINTAGVTGDGKGTKLTEWDPKLQVATKMLKGRWVVEVYVPFSELGLKDVPKPGSRWGFDLSRLNHDAKTDRYSRWAHSDAANHTPGSFGTIVFE